MWKFVIICTFLISSGKHPKTETYGRYFKECEKTEAVKWYKDRIEECACDSNMWKFITRKDMKDGIIIMVEIDSIN